MNKNTGKTNKYSSMVVVENSNTNNNNNNNNNNNLCVFLNNRFASETNGRATTKRKGMPKKFSYCLSFFLNELFVFCFSASGKRKETKRSGKSQENQRIKSHEICGM